MALRRAALCACACTAGTTRPLHAPLACAATHARAGPSVAGPSSAMARHIAAAAAAAAGLAGGLAGGCAAAASARADDSEEPDTWARAHAKPQVEVVTQNDEYVHGIKIFDIGILEDPVPVRQQPSARLSFC